MEDELTEAFSRFLTSWAMSQAILDDYCEVIAKIELTNAEIVRERIMNKTHEYFEKGKLKPKE